MRWQSLFLDPDSFNSDEYISVTLSISVASGRDCKLAASEILQILTLRTQNTEHARPAVPEVTGAVIHVGQQAPWTEITLALPSSSYVVSEGLGRLLELLTSPVEYGYASGVWVQRVDLPRQHLSELPGPKLGVSGMRTLLGVPTRPLLALEIGPRSSTLADDNLHLYETVLTEGADLLVDDMLMGDPPGSWNFRRRVRALSTLCAKVSQKVGRKKAYITCLAGTPGRLAANAQWARSEGVDGFVINAFTQGLGTLEDLTNASDGYAIFTTNMGSGVASRRPEEGENPRESRRVGVDEQVFSKLSRLGGADAVHTGSTGTQCVDVPWGDSVKALEQPIVGISRRIPSSFRVAEGDLQLKDLWPNVRELGSDTVFEVATALTGDSGKVKRRVRTFISILEGLSNVSTSESAVRLYREHVGRDQELKDQLDGLDLESW